MNEEQLQAARLKAIKSVAGANRTFWLCVTLTGMCELAFLIALIRHLNWSDPVQRLIAIATGLVYGTLGMAVMALGAYNRLWALRIVQAVQLGPDEPSAISNGK